MSIAAIIVSAALAENIVLTHMLGLCPFTGLSKRMDIAIGVGIATTIVLFIASAAAWLANEYLLHDITALHAPVFIALAAIIVQSAEHLMQLYFPRMHRMLGIYLPLITTNCAILAVMLLATRSDVMQSSLAAAAFYGLGGGLGFMLAVLCLATIRARIINTHIPASLRGAPITMITTGWMALAFSGLTNIV